jgi:tripartite-type tricarboxylate transporter receptor subunit TctC
VQERCVSDRHIVRYAGRASIVGICVFGVSAVLAQTPSTSIRVDVDAFPLRLAQGERTRASEASVQGYPSKPIRIFTTEVGGASDLPARLIAKELQASLGQPVLVENRAIIGVELVAQAAGDGHTLLHYTSPLWIIPLFRSNVSWDVNRDFTPIGLTVVTPNVLVVHPSLPVKSVKELIVLAKARPGDLNYGSSSTGSSNHLAGELFKSMAGVKIVRIAYKGGGSSLNALIAGELQLAFPSAGSAMGHVKAGKLRALAVTSAEPSALTPGLPTVAASGLPGYESISYTGMFAPAKTPAALVNRLSQEVAQGLRVPAVKERLFNVGSEVIASSPAEAAATIRSETERIRKLINDAGLREN